MNNERLLRQIEFVMELDRLKSVLRRSYLSDGSRNENSAEHSWHVALAAMLLAEYANEPVDLLRVVKMLLVHDVVEIDAGDTFVYDQQAMALKSEREKRAADRLFGMLPPDQGQDIRALWEEYEEHLTPKSRFAGALDRLMPMLHNFVTRGKSWKEHGVVKSDVLSINEPIGDGATKLWEYARSLVDDAVAKGFLPGGRN